MIYQHCFNNLRTFIFDFNYNTLSLLRFDIVILTEEQNIHIIRYSTAKVVLFPAVINGLVALWCLKPQGDSKSKVDSIYHLSEVDQRVTGILGVLVVKSKLSPPNILTALRQFNPVHKNCQ